MGHFAIVNGDKEVVEVITGADEELTVPEGYSSWEEYYGRLTPNCTVVRTSYNTYGGVHINGGTALRGNYATKGGLYDDVNDVFYTKKPHNGWVLNETTWKWEAPIPRPADENGKSWEWNESTETWDAVLDENITVE